MKRKKYFREHRGLYEESMQTKREVKGIDDIKDFLNSEYPNGYLQNICIDKSNFRAHRSKNDGWGDYTFMVIADFEGYKRQCVGYTNFEK